MQGLSTTIVMFINQGVCVQGGGGGCELLTNRNQPQTSPNSVPLQCVPARPYISSDSAIFTPQVMFLVGEEVIIYVIDRGLVLLPSPTPLLRLTCQSARSVADTHPTLPRTRSPLKSYLQIPCFPCFFLIPILEIWANFMRN